jgi:SPP1 gp7 family putative phage head morphogenesis protein
VEARQRKAWEQQVSQEIDAPWTAGAQDELVSDWTERVAEQVGSVRKRIAPGMARAVREAWAKGWTASDLEAHWREHGIPLEDGGTAEGQCATIGRDAGHSLAEQAMQALQEAAGVDWYEWVHNASPTPRPEHVARHGKRFRWSKPPADGHPGTLRNCRCTAKPVIKPQDAKRLAQEAGLVAAAPTRKRKPAKAAPGGGEATAGLRQEVQQWETQREDVLAKVVERLGPEAAAELRTLAERQRAVTKGRRGVTPTGDLVTDPQDSQRQRDRWIAGLSDEHRQALKDWSSEQWFGLMRSVDSGRGAEVWNDADARWTQEAERRMTSMREALATAPRYEGELTRGVRDLPKGSALRKALETQGAVVELEAVSSWSSDERSARSFATDDRGSYLLKVVTKRGAVVGDQRVSYTAHEAEVMLDRGARFRVVSVGKRPGDSQRKLVILEELDPA